MQIGIDASNINDGGGITHLSQVINNFDFKKSKCTGIVIWGNKKSLKKIKNKKNIKKINLNNKFSFILLRVFWQIFILEKELIRLNCSKALVLGGISFINKLPSIVIMQNILPFERLILNKYSFLFKIKCRLQKFLFIHSIKKAQKVIFLSDTSKNQIMKYVTKKKIKFKIIPHGVETDRISNRNFIFKKKVKLLCVSKIDFYKNQIIILKAIKILLKQGYNLELKLIGANYKPALRSIKSYLFQNNLEKFVKIFNQIDFKNIKKEYHKANIQIAPSFCESFGITLIESGNHSLPLICSNIKIFREITGNNTLFFNPANEEDLAKKIKEMIHNRFVRKKKIIGFYNFVNKKYSWKKVAKETINFVLK
tara:strand:- start:270 stop:1370 length:1101 start_codon:yes stop_codon:yes gene_type:complete